MYMLIFMLDDWIEGKPCRPWPWADLTIASLIGLDLIFRHYSLVS